jgi:FlaA1/EpsC-like NDP-sugar epimerase
MNEYKNILIIGAGIAGKLLKEDIEKNYPQCKIVGFIDDAVEKNHRVNILGKIDELSKINKIYKIDEMVIAIPSAEGSLIRKILLNNLKNRVLIKTVPREQRIISLSQVHYSEVRNLKTGDFLGRPFVKKQIKKLQYFYKDKKVLVTGGAGSIGSEIAKQLIELKAKKVIVYDVSEFFIFNLEQYLKENGIKGNHKLIVGNILNKKKLNQVVKQEKPDIIFHAAACKYIHLMEDNIDEAIITNVIGTKNVIDIALENKIEKMTFISTDKVVNPTSVMGASKKICEFYINSLISADTKFNIVRFGNVINSNGSVLPLFERQVEEYKYVTVTHKKMMRFFMSIREAAQLVIESSANKSNDAIHILDMGELISVFEIAQCLIRSKNLIPEKDVEIRFIGLRKGEKMIEELYTEVEKGSMKKKRTGNIFVLKNFEKCPENINDVLGKFKKIAENYDNSTKKLIKDILKQLFPSLKLN